MSVPDYAYILVYADGTVATRQGVFHDVFEAAACADAMLEYANERVEIVALVREE